MRRAANNKTITLVEIRWQGRFNHEDKELMEAISRVTDTNGEGKCGDEKWQD